MEQDKVWDVAVIGCGPAGISAAINARIRNREVLIFGTELCSPSLHKAGKIINYPGFPSITGEELRLKFLDHAAALGIKITRKKIESIYHLGETFLMTYKQESFQVRSVIITTGVAYPGYLPGEKEFLGRGVGYCATCDGPFFRDQEVAVIAHSAEAESDAAFLAEICSRVYYLPLYPAQNLDQRLTLLKGKPKLITGQDTVSELHTDQEVIKVQGIFIVGSEVPPERLVPGVELEEGFYKVNRSMETNIPGLFAAGDCTGRPYQLAKSVGEGQVAGLAASAFVRTVDKNKGS